jgi:putative endonuclease
MARRIEHGTEEHAVLGRSTAPAVPVGRNGGTEWNSGYQGGEPTQAIAPAARRMAGDAGEAIARNWLLAARWEILEQNVNFRCGELDIVARDGEQIVFVEVRSRWTSAGGTGAHSVGRGKQQRLTRAAQLYLQRRGWTRVSARFDVVSVDLRTGRVVEHFRGAFEACGA